MTVYADRVQGNGSGGNFVQQYVKEGAHCHFTGAETAAALEELIQWKHTGVHPKGGAPPLHEK